MSIGQGYVLATPIQIAVAYGGIATGSMVKPHLLKDVRTDDGKPIVSKQKEVLNVPDVTPQNLEVIRDALHGVSVENSSVSRHFSNVGFSVAAKTGTAEVANKNDFA